jgi:ribosomal protein S27AE
MPAVEDTRCPQCGEKTLSVDQVLQAKPIGTYSLAGAQPKVDAEYQLRWSCGSCGQSGPALVASKQLPAA